MAIVFMFLHELRHIQLSNKGDVIGMLEEELACDEYARSLLRLSLLQVFQFNTFHVSSGTI
jgi:hypothetical protein